MTIPASEPLSSPNPNGYQTNPAPSDLLSQFINQYQELQSYKNGKSIVLDGQSLTVAGVVGVARYGASVALKDTPEIRERMAKSRGVLISKVQTAKSVYGVSTGLGGSADTRTNDTIGLGHALLQHHHTGVLPSMVSFRGPLPALPLSDPLATTSMPEAWVRGAILVRINSLVRGHSAVRWELLERMAVLLREDITPCVPLRGSISASGDLTPLAYVAGTIAGIRNIRVFDGPRAFGAREIVSCRKALDRHHIEPLPLLEKENLGIMNGTAFSASVASLALHDAVHLALLAQVCTAMGTEALIGVRANYDPFIHEVARPHPGQVEAARTIWDLLKGSTLAGGHEKDVTIEQDQGELRQDRYTLRTAPQFLGPQIEDIVSALNVVTIECNSTTDNPLFNGETGEVHHGGNFQAMAVTNAMEKTRLALHHIGKLLFAQATELMNPAMNRGLPPSLAASDPSLNYHGKGLDIAVAAYTSELGFLANPVSTHIQSAEMHNQAVNSLALISARATITSLEVLSMLTATYLYLLCQALDIRAMQAKFEKELHEIVQEEFLANFGSYITPLEAASLFKHVLNGMFAVLDTTTTMDVTDRMAKVAASGDSILVKHFTQPQGSGIIALSGLRGFNVGVAKRAAASLTALREAYLTGARGHAPASVHLSRTRPVYDFIRIKLGIGMHGLENHRSFPNGLDLEDATIGENVSLIHEAIRDGELQRIVVGLFLKLTD
ncbi:phenylalanine ammonia-lyase [Multifurca ochricompacta]|uniref:Phenylalanine ammonia-lyase n=1 Tax=Multifurca ochricompacta TaxID=376703 RepID=A0AAD4M601_9AGAM|nr:phenylalanine ammonia-lyase [Multifurca ochricompacta]